MKKKILVSGIIVFGLFLISMTHYLAYSRGSFIIAKDIIERQVPELLPRLCGERWSKIKEYSEVSNNEYLKMSENCTRITVKAEAPSDVFGDVWVCPKIIVKDKPETSKLDGSIGTYIKADRLIQKAMLQTLSESLKNIKK